MNYSAETLCERAARGDADAASELLAGHYRPIFAYFRRLSGSEPDAGDLTQKAFAKAWQSLPSFQRRSAFSTWLHAIAHHLYVD